MVRPHVERQDLVGPDMERGRLDVRLVGRGRFALGAVGGRLVEHRVGLVTCERDGRRTVRFASGP